MPCYNVFTYWFYPVAETPNMWSVIAKNEPSIEIGTVDDKLTPNSFPEIMLSEGHSDKLDEISIQFKLFTQRPEYVVRRPVASINILDQASLIEEYEVRLVGIIFNRVINAGKNPDDNISSAMHCIDWLRSTDFYNAPGSTQYHDSEPSGLLKHSLRVFNHIIRLRNDEAFQSVSVYSAALVALTHDWCKIGLYELYMRNVKNDETGKWEQVPSYRHNQKGIPLGHGVTSMFLVSKFFKLSSAEALALRWHMGEYNVAHNEQNDLHLANETTPLVFLVQFADRLAIAKYAN